MLPLSFIGISGRASTNHVYELVLVYELAKRNLTSRQQTPVPLVYEGMTFDIGFKT
ncbi:MAG: hypothetical protein JO077_26975, partial [Verrucomicrobia bacterium]|nr:hypothetical protein [Verrucomicrobiota bacterium]